jgi:hypothetical protein
MFMKIINITFIVILLCNPLYAADFGDFFQGLSGGINQGIQNARQIEEIRAMQEQRRLLEEQRQLLEQQRLMLEQQNRRDAEQNAKYMTYDQFISYMDNNVPDWRTIDETREFEMWLNDKIPYTKVTKRQVIEEASRNFDGETVAKFFIDYKASFQSPRR